MRVLGLDSVRRARSDNTQAIILNLEVSNGADVPRCSFGMRLIGAFPVFHVTGSLWFCREMVRGVGLWSEKKLFVGVEFGWNECQARQSIQWTRPMLGCRADGKAFCQVVSTSPTREDVCTQRGKTPRHTAEKAADLLSLTNQSFGGDDFPLEFGPQLPDDLAYRRPISPGRLRMGQFRPGVGKGLGNWLCRNEQFRIQRNSCGIARVCFPKAQRRGIPDAGRGTSSQPAGPPQTISVLNSTRQLIQNFVSWQHVGHPL